MYFFHLTLFINHHLMVWLQSYLTLQSQQVVVDGCSSFKSTILSGIPQGSNLGLLLFILYVNDIFQLPFSSTSSIVLYADDILLSCPFKSSYEYSLAQSNVNILSSWVKSKHLTIIITQKPNTCSFPGSLQTYSICVCRQK